MNVKVELAAFVSALEFAVAIATWWFTGDVMRG